MSLETFRGNFRPSLGVELEFQLVDAESMALSNAVDDVFAALPSSALDSVKPEFYRSCLEINSDVCADVDEVRRDLEPRIAELDRAARCAGVRLAWGGTHPFSHWRDQEVVQTPRYKELVEQYRETLCRQVTFGLHVHVGVPSGDEAIKVCDGLREYIPVLLALSANSPFWCGRATGLLSHRTEIMAASPVSGPPPAMGSWAHFEALVDRLSSCGMIQTPKELWWDLRPNASLGTVEVRVCDMPADLPTTLGIVALIQCLVHRIVQADAYSHADEECESLILDQNRWRAARHGLDAMFADLNTSQTQSARDVLEQLVHELEATAVELHCDGWLAYAGTMARQPIGAEQQLAEFERTGNLVDVARYQADWASRGLNLLASNRWIESRRPRVVTPSVPMLSY